jgi:class 3 adenylate cyclase
VGDEDRLIQVMNNLLGNAIKFTQKGSICVSVEMEEPVAGQKDKFVRISVVDTGIGMPKDALVKIFQPFTQVNDVTTRTFGGTGLGLSLVQNLVHAHNGEIKVDSTVGKGSIFSFTLPVAGDETAETSPRPSSSVAEEDGAEVFDLRKLDSGRRSTSSAKSSTAVEVSPEAKLPTKPREREKTMHEASSGSQWSSKSKGIPVTAEAGLETCELSLSSFSHSEDGDHDSDWRKEGRLSRLSFDDDGVTISKGKDMRPYHKDTTGQALVLSIDDDAINHMVLEGFLKPNGFSMQIAMNGPEALTFLTDTKVLPDVILLDVMMPGMSGYEVNAKIKEMFPNICIPIIMVSAKSTEEDIIQGLSSGSHDYIKKPFHQGELLARVRTQLQLKDAWKTNLESSVSVALLQKILPSNIINRLTSGATTVADDHPETTILFSDVCGFTTLASSLSTREVMTLLNSMFTGFDKLVDRNKVYKVETIGDAYMAASGHDGTSDHVQRMFNMACDMLNDVKKIKFKGKEAALMGSRHLRIRVGLHTGPTYAGVIGRKCPRYCFFGDTVNTASRMESTGAPMCIQVTETFFNI